MRINIIFFLTIIITIIAGCGSQKNEEFIIKISGISIEKNEFLAEYSQFLLMPHTKDSDTSRVQFAHYMLNRRLLASLADSFAVAKEPLIELDIKKTSEKFIRQAFLDSLVNQKIQEPSDSLLRAVFTKMNEKRMIAHLVYTDSITAWKKFQQLQKNETNFENEAFVLFQDSVLKNNGGNLGWLRWDQLDYSLAEKAFKSPTNKVLEPIKNKNNYHILRIIKIEKGLFLSETDYLREKKRLKSIYHQSRYRHEAFKIIQDILKTQEILVDQGRLESLQSIIDQLINKEPLLFYPNYDQARSEFHFHVDALSIIQNKVIASFDGDSLTVAQLLNHIPYLDPSIINSGIREILGYTARDLKMDQIAAQTNIKNNPKILKKIKLYKEKIYSEKIKKIIQDQALITEDEKINYYKNNFDRFTDQGIPFLRVHCLYGEEKTLNQIKDILTLNNIDSILQKYKLNYKLFKEFTFFENQKIYNFIYEKKEGTIFGPLLDKKGYFIGLIEKKGFLPQDYKNLEKSIYSQLLSQKRDSLFHSTIKDLKGDNSIIINKELIKNLID